MGVNSVACRGVSLDPLGPSARTTAARGQRGQARASILVLQKRSRGFDTAVPHPQQLRTANKSFEDMCLARENNAGAKPATAVPGLFAQIAVQTLPACQDESTNGENS